MDVAYFVRPGDDNEELRYSLRSLKNIPHNKVYIAGHLPKWLTNVEHIYVPQGSNKNLNTTDNLRAIAKENSVSEQFILMNDDFFIMKPMRTIPRMNRGPIEVVLDEYREVNSGYFQGMEQTHEYMIRLGFDDILSYELHVPMIMQKDNILEMLIRYNTDQPDIRPLHKRTLYGNMFNYGGVSMKDVKVYAHGQKFDKIVTSYPLRMVPSRTGKSESLSAVNSQKRVSMKNDIKLEVQNSTIKGNTNV